MAVRAGTARIAPPKRKTPPGQKWGGEPLTIYGHVTGYGQATNCPLDRETSGEFLCLRDTRASEILAGRKQRHACDRCDRIRHAVPEVQSGGMAAPSEPDKRGCRGVEVFLVERYHLGFHAAQKSEEHRTGILSEPRGQYHCCFE